MARDEETGIAEVLVRGTGSAREPRGLICVVVLEVSATYACRINDGVRTFCLQPRGVVSEVLIWDDDGSRPQ